MVKKLITAVGCVALVAAALSASAAASHRNRANVSAGHTAQGRRIRVAIYGQKIELKHFTVGLRCHGASLIDVESGFLPSRLRNRNRIHDHQVGSTDDVYIRGRLGNHHLHGAIRVRDRLGRRRCDSHWVRFSVRR